MATVTMDTQIELHLVDCANCGVVFGVTTRLIAERRKDGKNFYCPNGHVLTYGTTEADHLRKELDRTRARLTSTEDQRIAAERSNAALRGVITQERKRVSNGVCHCCKRSFSNLARHMAGKHPDFTDAVIAG